MLIRYQGRSLIVHTPAKLNLFLEVLGKRDDGFHELETLMTTVGLYDTLSFTEESNPQIELNVIDAGSAYGIDAAQSSPLSTGRNNLVVQAANLLREYAGVTKGACITLIKRIPVAAGLAGGSSDAAATLVALNRLWKLNLAGDELQHLASQLGSDVRFFLSPTSLALCRGRGEIITPLNLPHCLHFVIARPRTGLATAVVFRHCRPSPSPLSAESLISNLTAGRLGRAARFLHNSLQAPARQLNAEVEQLESIFSRQPVYGHMMSGSGTSYFALCANRRQAIAVAARIRQTRIGRVFVTQSRP